MTTIIIIGTGSLARHWFDAFMEHDNLKVVQVLGRNKNALAYYGQTTGTSADLGSIQDADIYINAVRDDAIYAICQGLTIKGKLIVHCSGSLDISAMPAHNRRGVLYPVQTFSEGRKVDFREIPICIESENERDLKFLHGLANQLSGKVFKVSSTQRRNIHLAAVFVNNFTNYLYGIGEEICKENGLPFTILDPLIKETAAKIGEVSPKKAQTGPARRLDTGTINKHLELLKQKSYHEIYAVLSKSIEQTYSEGTGRATPER